LLSAVAESGEAFKGIPLGWGGVDYDSALGEWNGGRKGKGERGINERSARWIFERKIESL
jgi:hypothetical protein